MVLILGLAPRAYALRGRCSAAELNQQVWERVMDLHHRPSVYETDELLLLQRAHNIMVEIGR